ncbi:MAG TPA: biotin synthase BioB [Nitrospirota bacterium]
MKELDIPVRYMETALSTEGITVYDVPGLISALGDDPWGMFAAAGRLRDRRFGNRVDACSIINAKSGNCSEDCAYCAQSAHHDTGAEVYPLLPEDRIAGAAQRAFDHGVRRFCIVTSGKAIYTDSEMSSIARCVELIRDIGIMPCATLGSLDKNQMRTLRDAGLNRFHHNIETSRSFFPKVCTTHDYDERVETLELAREAGLSLCSGGIIGMGETMADRAEMALALKDLKVDSVPLNFLMPIPGTPLADAPPISPLDALRTIALFRLILPETEIRVCGGRVKGLGELHPLIFMSGANGVLTGDYLTTTGRDYCRDLNMLSALGLEVAYD